MKMFKKLAAVALAAVLALSMVGCGAGGTGSSSDLASAVKDYMSDQIKMSSGLNAEHKDELDTLAENLIREADKASATEEMKDKTALELLGDPEVVKAAGIEDTTNYRFVLIKSTFSSNFYNDNKVMAIGESLTSSLYGYSAEEYGLANGKISGTEYILMMMKVSSSAN